MSVEITPELISCLQDRYWRINNLYSIKTAKGIKIPFKLNWAQEDFFWNMHYFNLVLKARQLGFTTMLAIYFLDACLWNSNTNAAIIADLAKNSKEIFIDKVKFAYDNLNPVIKSLVQAYRDSATEMRFSNGSVFRVSTSLRSGTVQLLHISEFGKICRESPQKAQEIIAGALNTVHAGQFITIESTAEGRDGHYYNMVKSAQDRQDKGIKPGILDFKLFFYPWWKEPSYRLEEEVA